MALYKNVAGQKLAVFAWDTANQVPKTGDAANITAQITKDWGTPAATNDTNPSELDATDHPGIYLFDLTQAEVNADVLLVSPVSSTDDISLEPVQVFTTPNRFRELVIDANGAASADVTKVSGDATAADNLEKYLDGTEYMPVDPHKVTFSVSGDTLTVKMPDGTTTAYTKTLTTDESAEPITGAS